MQSWTSSSATTSLAPFMPAPWPSSASAARGPSAGTTAMSPASTTRDLVVEERGFEYDCNAYNDDLPYWTKARATPGRSFHTPGGQRLQVMDRRPSHPGALLPGRRGQLRPTPRGGRHPPEDDVRRPALPHHRQTQPRPRSGTVPEVRIRMKKASKFSRRLDISRW